MLNGLEKIEGLTPEQIEAINGIASGLINKKTELEEKLSKTKSLVNENQSAAEKLAMLEASLERERLEAQENYQGALSIKDKEYNANLEKLTGAISEKDSLIHKLLVDNGLTSELMKYNVSKELMPLIQKALSSQATIVEGQAMIDDKPLSEYIKEWSETPQGKASIIAPSNQGGNGSGGSNSPVVKKMQDMTEQERVELFRKDPNEFNRLKNEM